MIKRFLLVCLIFSMSFAYCFATDSAISSTSDVQVLPERQVLLSVDVSKRSVKASQVSGFKSVLLGLFGDYDTIVTDYTYQSSSGYTTHSIDVSPDYVWICSAGIFALVLFCVFRIVGKLIEG